MKPPGNIQKKTAAFFLLFLLSINLHAIEPVLTISPDNPIMDNSGESGTASFQLDVSPETKFSLTGTGQIAVELRANQFTTQLIGPERVFIHYTNGKTTPVTVNFRKAPWMPNPANEFEDKLYFVAAQSGDSRVVAQAISRGSYYSTVRDYMMRRTDLYWIPPQVAADGRYSYDLVRYLVPESAFSTWAQTASDPATIAAGYQLGYSPKDMLAKGTVDITSPYGLYDLESFGWKSQAEILALEQDYSESIRPINNNFSFCLRNRVPVSFFLANFSSLPADMDSGIKDYSIAALYHKTAALDRWNGLGYDGRAVMEQLKTNYNLNDYLSIPPHAAEAIAKTYMDSTWRQTAPLALVVTTRGMQEGTFSEGAITGHLAQTHRLIVGQCDNAEDFIKIAKQAYQRNGGFDIVVFAGHGTHANASCLNTEDKAAFTELAKMSKPGATILLASCSGAAFYPDSIYQRTLVGQSSAIHIAAAMQASMPNARVVAANDLISKALLRYDPAANTPAGRYRVFFQGAGAIGAIAGQTTRGVPHDWLSREFGIAGSTTGSAVDWSTLEQQDSDADGQSNWFEYLAGTNPRSAQDFFKILNLTTVSGISTIQWSGSRRNEHNKPFKVFRSSNATTGPWQETASGINLSVYGNTTYSDSSLGNSGQTFYRVGPTAEVMVSSTGSKVSQTIGTFTPVGGKAFGSAFSVIPPTASSGLPVVLSVKIGPATITANNTVTPTGLGTVVLAANQAGNVNYNAAPEVTTSFVVGKGNQTISAFSAIGPKLVGASPFVISAPSASSALPVVLTIKSGPATISTNRTVTITGPGNVTIAANQPGNTNFNSAPEVTTTFRVTRPLSTLTVTVPAANEGTVTLGFAGATTREIGANYTVTAIPASGMMSKGWRKGNATLSANATLNFVMEANMQLMPLFAPDFSKLAGTYNGLVGNGDIGTGAAQDMQAFPLKNGFVTFSLGSTGALSGNLSIDGQTSRFTGNLSTNRTAAITISRANKTPAQASLQLTPALPGEISGNITVSGEALSFRALRAAYTIGTAAHALGSRAYTLAIPAPSGLALGHGFATISIQPTGFATATGRLATGDAISASAGFVDSGDGNWVMPVYSTGNGIFTGEIVIPKTPSINSAELLGSFEWLRPANAASPLFPAGFLGRTNVAGTRYSISTGNSLLSGNRTATGFTLNIDSQRALLPTAIAQKGTWPSNNTPAFVQPISSGLQMTFSSANGSLQGVFNRTINGAQVPTQFQGAMFGKRVSTGNGQPLLRGAGFFISGNKSVPVEITVP